RFIYEVAENAEEAWELIKELQADGIDIIVIVSDWLMPRTKGDEFLIQIHQCFPKITKIMLTGQADENAIERAKQEANLHACLYKPWTEEELAQIITNALD
ncbi:MAG: response regulator, partial [Xenococcaceae cyanobacterium]